MIDITKLNDEELEILFLKVLKERNYRISSKKRLEEDI